MRSVHQLTIFPSQANRGHNEMPYHIRANLPVNAPTRGDGVRVAYTSRGANRLTELVHEAFDQVIRDISHELNILVLHKFVAGVLLGDSVIRIAPKNFRLCSG